MRVKGESKWMNVTRTTCLNDWVSIWMNQEQKTSYICSISHSQPRRAVWSLLVTYGWFFGEDEYVYILIKCQKWQWHHRWILFEWKLFEGQELYSLGIFSVFEQLLCFADVLRGLVDDPFDVGEVGEAVLYLHDHFVHSGLVDRQPDWQDLQSHLLDALWVGSLLWTTQTQQMLHQNFCAVENLLQAELKTWSSVRAKMIRNIINLPVRKSLIFLMNSFSFLFEFSKCSFFFWAFSSVFFAWFFTSCVREAISWSWSREVF